MTAADIYWAPYLERLNAYVPTLHRGLKFRSGVYDAITEWFDAMDARVPAYACRVKGRAATWQQVLAQEHPELQQEVEPTGNPNPNPIPNSNPIPNPNPNPNPNPSPNPNHNPNPNPNLNPNANQSSPRGTLTPTLKPYP